MTGDLGTTSDPVVLVPGSPRAVWLDADDLEARARELTEASERIRTRVVQDWSGASAEGWTTRQAGLSTTCAVVAEVYLAVAAAVRRHGDVLAQAQRGAQEAVDLWDGRQAVSQVSQCRADTVWSLDDAAGWLAASPASAAERAQAETLLKAARADVRASGSGLAALLQEFSAGLPDGQWHTGQFFNGVLAWASEVVTLAWRLSPLRAAIDNEGSRADGAQMVAGTVATWHAFERDPYNTTALVLDAQTLTDDPALWWGRAAPDLVLAVTPTAVSSAGLAGLRWAPRGAGPTRLPSVAGTIDLGPPQAVLGSGDDVAAALEATARARATLYTGARDLRWRMASEGQMAEVGKVIAGPGSPDILHDAPRLAAQYGGDVDDWAKMTSHSYTRDGRSFQTHWYENLATGVRLEAKTKVAEWERR